MTTSHHEEFHVIEATILKDARTSSEERKVWIKYRKKQEGSPSFTKIFRFKNPQIIPDPGGNGFVFKEIASFKEKVMAGEIGFTISSKPLIEASSIRSIVSKKKLEQEYAENHTPERIFLPPNFPHRNG